MITEEFLRDASCCYELGFDEKIPAIIVRIREEFLSSPILLNKRTLNFILNQFGFSGFSGDFRGDFFGFDNILRKSEKSGCFVQFFAEIPTLEKFHTKPCYYCQGRKKDLLFGGECPACFGNGEERKTKICFFCEGKKKDFSNRDCEHCLGSGSEADAYLDWKPLNAISATFMLFFEAINWIVRPRQAVINPFPQLFWVNAYIDKDIGAASLSGAYLPVMVDWFKKNPERIINESEDAMRIVSTKINGEFDEMDKMNTSAIVGKRGFFFINCFGDRTGLFPDSYFGTGDRKEGYKFYSHNLGTSAQQITLLAGLAALCDKIRQKPI